MYIASQNTAEPVRGSDICAYQNMAKRHLEPVLQHLVHAGILRGVRGPRGGYVLAKERRKIKLMDIYKAVAKMEAEEKDANPSPLHEKLMVPIYNGFAKSMEQELNNTTVQEMCDKAQKLGVKLEKGTKSDFAI